MIRMATIYSITSDKGNKVYIGSTTNYPRRVRQHKHGDTANSRLLKEEYGIENLIFTVLEECPIEQCYEREKFYMDITPNVVNQRPPKGYGMTSQEWIKSNKESINKQRKEYREANKELIKQQKHESHKRTYEANKDEINQKRRESRKAKKEYVPI